LLTTPGVMVDLVLVPGLLCTSALFASQTAALNGVANVHIPEHRQHDTMQAIAESILSQAPEAFVLGGLSMGGYIAFEILRQAPERVSGLILMDSNARADLDVQKAQRQAFIDEVLRDGLLEPVLDAFLPLMVHPDRLCDKDLEGVIRAMGEETGIDAYVRQQKAIMERRDNRPFLQHISCPALVIVGEQDVVTPLKVAREMADGISGARLEIIPECGHLAPLERPATVNRLMREFVLSLKIKKRCVT